MDDEVKAKYNELKHKAEHGKSSRVKKIRDTTHHKNMETDRRHRPSDREFDVRTYSKMDKDDVIDCIKGVKRIKLNEEILDADIDIKDLKNSLIICDDIDTITNKQVCKLVANLRDDLLENARHYNIYLCCVSHQILNYKSTRHLILESDIIVFFPRSGGYQIKRFLKEYMSLERKQVDDVMKIPSRWIAINKNTFPNTYIGENDIYIL